MGLSDAWARTLLSHGQAATGRRQVLVVVRATAGSDAAEKLKSGDVVLAVGGRPVVTFRDVEEGMRAAEAANAAANAAAADAAGAAVGVADAALPSSEEEGDLACKKKKKKEEEDDDDDNGMQQTDEPTAPSEEAAAAAAAARDNTVSVIVLRDGSELTVDVAPTVLPPMGTSRIVSWCGLLLQAPHYAVKK